MLGRQPTQTLATTPAEATPANAATMPVDEAHHSKDMMHSNPANRNFNLPSLNSAEMEIQGAALNNDPEQHKNSVIQSNIKNLKFSIEAILSKNDNIKLAHQELNQKKKTAPQAKIYNVMQNLQSPTSRHSNVEQQEGNPSKLMSNSARSNSNQIELHQDNENAELELQLQEVTSPSVPPGFKAAGLHAE